MTEQDLNAQEIWESTTGGTTFVSVKDPRNANGWVRKKVGGKGTQRITLTIEERLFNQELVAYEREHQDPFRNGLLVRVSPKVEVEDRFDSEVTDDQLVALLKADGDDAFVETAKAVTSEVVLRRMLELARRHATMLRYEVLDEIIQERFAIGKTQKVVAEMMRDDEKYAGADL